MRALADRYEAYTDEVRRLLDAAFSVMRRTGSVSPRVSEIVREAGLSNQAFYRHFASKDELLVAVLDDGLQQLVDYLGHVMAKADTPLGQVRRWVEGILAQAVDAQAASSTRPFVVNSLRLRDQFRDEVQRSDERLKAPLRAALAAVPTADRATRRPSTSWPWDACTRSCSRVSARPAATWSTRSSSRSADCDMTASNREPNRGA